jgi:hypothetical protein
VHQKKKYGIFFYRAILRFNESGWGIDYGGKLWTHIARLGFEMWTKQAERQRGFYVDQVFSAEHNSGMVFDKHDAICSITKTDKLFLDAKFKASDIDALFTSFEELVETNKRLNRKETKQLLRSLHDRALRAKSLTQSPRWSVGHE